MSIKSYIKILRPANCIMGAIAVFIGAMLTGAISLQSLYSLQVLLAMAVVFLITGFGMIVNDIYDIEIDKINKPKRPLPSGKISIKAAWIYAMALFVIGIGLSWFVNADAFFLALIVSMLLFYYAKSFKKIMFLGNIIVSILVALTFVYGGFINMNLVPVLILGILAFFSNMGREVFKTCEDVLGDKKGKANTIAVKYGVLRTKALGSIFVLLAVIMSVIPFLIGMLGIYYMIIVAIADALFIASALMPVKHSSKLTKIAMMVALIAFLVGAVIK